MSHYSRKLVLDVFDYNNHKLCTIYDSAINVQGQAYDVFITTERNGWRELTFNIPSTINTAEGVEQNYRLDYIQPDYRIRAIDDNGTDWFIITEPSYSHVGKNKDVAVKAGHVCQLLKNKNLDLEFSDQEGNNVGTAEELAEAILTGTGWSVGNVTTFYEKDGQTIKKRSMKAAAKTGAFKLMTNMCNLFEAKPIYHGDDKTVDIVPINPFTKPVDGGLPDVTNADGVMELAYSKNVSNVTRTMNSENLVTRLYAYGSYGDTTSGYCGIDECTHIEHTFVTNAVLQANTVYKFSVVDKTGTTIHRNFKTDRQIPSRSTVIFSTLDPASQMYVWVQSSNGSTFADTRSSIWNDISNGTWQQIASQVSTDGYAYLVNQGQSGTQLPYNVASGYKQVVVQNWFSFLMDFEYFRDVNLLTNVGLQKIAGYQRFAASSHQEIYLKSLEMSESLSDLSDTIGDVPFCKLDVASVGSTGNDGLLRVNLNKTTEHPDGVLYRTDYMLNKRNYFKWLPSLELKKNGDPKTAGASMLFIIHNTTPVTWTQGYLKAVDDKDDPGQLTFHIEYSSSYISTLSSDRYFLFESNSINGRLGALEALDESTVTALKNKTKVVTVNHEVGYGKTLPAIAQISDSNIPDIPSWYKIDEYGWFWKYSDSDNVASELYFCFYETDANNWRRVYYQNTDPGSVSNNTYWYNWSTSALYRRVSGAWTRLDDDQWKKIANTFSPVYRACRQRDSYLKGVYRNYTYTVPNVGLAGGNYYIPAPYDDFNVFTLKTNLSNGDALTYDTDENWIVLAQNGSLQPISADLTMEAGSISSAGQLTDDTTKCRSANYIAVTPGQSYTLEGFSVVYPLTLFKYNNSNEIVERVDNLSGYNGTFEAQSGVTKIKLTCDVHYQVFNSFSSFKILAGTRKIIETKRYRFDNVKYGENDKIIIQDIEYSSLTPIVSSGDKKGIIALTQKFANKADEAYVTNYDALVAAQNALTELNLSMSNTLGDMHREGYWQKKDYVNGDEDKLYDDALDTICEISQPKATYNVSYLDLYGSDNDATYGASTISATTAWPDLSICSAVHLTDEEININCWAYIDKINKCYDAPWKTKISINTDLSTISQHTFSDVMSNIADVASKVNAKDELIDRASAINGLGKMQTNSLEGRIDATKLKLFGGSSAWYTDDQGNMVFESADGTAAMTLTGSGFSIANGKDENGEWLWRTFGTGEGFLADEIVAGYLEGELIRAGTISVDKVVSDFGAVIDISDNNSITSIVSTQVRVFTQWDDPANTASNHVKDGDIWVQDNKIRTWGSPGSATNTQAAYYTWDGLSPYPWESFLGTKSFVRKNDTWVVLADMSVVMQQETKIEQNAQQIQMTADSLKSTNGLVENYHAEFTVTSEAITQRVENTEGEVSQLTVTAQGLEHEVYDEDGSVSVLRNNVNGLSAEVTDAQGSIASLAVRVDGISTEISTIETDYATKDYVAQTYTNDVIWYLATSQGTGVTTETSGWTTTPQTITNTDKYLWIYHTYTYTNGTTTNTTPIISGVYGNQGNPGTSGVGISSVTEYYAINNSSSSAPADSSFSTTVVSPTANNRYLWNYEKITKTDSSTQKSEKHVIGVYGETGGNGVSITGVINWYLATSASSGVTRGTAGWTTDVQTTDNSKRYLWNYEEITYSSGDPTYTSPCIIGTYGSKGDTGATGKGISSAVSIYMVKSVNNRPSVPNAEVTQTSSTVKDTWTLACPEVTDTYKYLYTSTQIAWTDNTMTWTTPMLDQAISSTITQVITVKQTLTDAGIYTMVGQSQSVQSLVAAGTETAKTEAKSYTDQEVGSLSSTVSSTYLTQANAASTYASKQYVNENNFTYTQWADPVTTETKRNIIDGDIWFKNNGIRTWSQMTGLTWGAAGSTSTSTASTYKWRNFMGPVMYVRQNNAWVEDVDYADVAINQTKIEQTDTTITLLATKEEVQGGVPRVANSALVVDSTGIYMRGGQIYMKSGTTFTVESNNFNIDASGNVTMTGTVTAASGKIGGWTLGANKLSSGSGTGYVALDSNTSDTYAIWAGSATDSSAPFSVKRNGEIKATSGTVGGWTLGATKISSGSGSTYVHMSTNDTYAFQAGSDTAANAPFRVKNDGTVYLTKLKALAGEDSQGQPIEVDVNLGTYPLWKLNYSTVKSYTTNSITLSNGAVVNFNTAASVTMDGSWSGGTFTVTNSGNSNTVSATLTVSPQNLGTGQLNTRTINTFNSNHKAYVNITVSQTGTSGPSPGLLFCVNADATSEYTTGHTSGWNDARAKVEAPSAGTGTSFTVKVPSATEGQQQPLTFTVTKGTPSALGGFAAVSYNSYAVGRIALDDWWEAGYAAGWAAARAKISRNQGNIYGPPETVDGSAELLYEVTAGGSISSITNVAEKTYVANGRAIALVNNVSVDEKLLSKTQVFS